MKKIEKWPHIPYFHWRNHLLLAIFVAWFLNTPTQYSAFVKLIQQQNYHEAMAYSFSMSFFSTIMVQKVSIWLDQKQPWDKAPLKRAGLQFLLGVVPIVGLCYAGAVMYFTWVNGDLLLSDYLVLEFPLVQGGILMLNIAYFALYFIGKAKASSKYTQKITGVLGRRSFFIPVKDIACLIRTEKEGYAILKNNKCMHINYIMNELEELLNPEMFFRINRSVMVAVDAIEGLKGVDNMQCELMLNVQTPAGTKLRVTRERTKLLRELLERKEMLIVDKIKAKQRRKHYELKKTLIKFG